MLSTTGDAKPTLLVRRLRDPVSGVTASPGAAGDAPFAPFKRTGLGPPSAGELSWLEPCRSQRKITALSGCTENLQHHTSKLHAVRTDSTVGCWVLDVGCWLLLQCSLVKAMLSVRSTSFTPMWGRLCPEGPRACFQRQLQDVDFDLEAIRSDCRWT